MVIQSSAIKQSFQGHMENKTGAILGGRYPYWGALWMPPQKNYVYSKQKLNVDFDFVAKHDQGGSNVHETWVKTGNKGLF